MNINKIKGLFYGCIAAITYGMNPLFALPLYKAGLDVDSVLFYRYSIAVVILGLWMKFKGESFKITQKEIIPLILGGLVFSASSLFLFLSYNYMDAGIASTILFVYPLLVALIMLVFYHERMSFIIWSGILLALSGILLLSKGTDGGHLSFVGLAFVLLSSLSYAIYLVGVNHSVLCSIPSQRLTFYALLFGLMIYVVRLDFCIGLVPIQSWQGGLNVFALALLPTVLSLLCTTKAIHHIGSTPTALLGALEPVTALFFGVMLFGEHLTSRILTGICLVLVAVTLIVIEKPVLNGLKQIVKRIH